MLAKGELTWENNRLLLETSIGDSIATQAGPLLRSSCANGLSGKASATYPKVLDPFLGPGGGMSLKDGLDASGRKPKGKGVYQFVDKYGANVNGYTVLSSAKPRYTQQ
ncbi:hypothetical protein H6P81_002976 [Aristolochia fimbriata]|uniref:Photosystem II 10 kDa polypeptide, chloroplastic n=1 Tax=Aristolochia fimbriata TaxID=158543 RepID=A0AAV7FBH7_ARIFI|nr:hypothetical protein H6P81_002976 [Aristolochia fimbriata]